MSILSLILNGYLHHLPDFRGKWRLLAPFRRFLDGQPVRSRYSGVIVGLDVKDRTNQLGVMGKYGAAVPAEIGKLAEGHCFIDVGANCGVFSLLAAERVGPSGLVLAFEPCFSTFTKLVRNIGLNCSHNTLPFNLAVGTATKPDLLDRGPKGHSGKYAIANGPAENCEIITSLSIDDFPGILKIIADRKIMIKIDVEGFELSVLKGLASILENSNTYKVIVEIDDRNLGKYGVNQQHIYSLLDRYGFERADDPNGRNHFDAVFSRGTQPPLPAARMPRHKPLPPQRAFSTAVATWPRRAAAIAAAVLILAAGWGTVQAGYRLSRAVEHEQFVEEALQSHWIAQTRIRLRRSPAAEYDVGGLASEARIMIPHLPPGWRVSEVQLFPSESGPALQLLIRKNGAEPISLFAARHRNAAPVKPDVVTRDGNSIAYWQEGEQAYAIIGTRPPAEIDRLAEDVADNLSL